jgi:phage tail-like protein
MPTGGRIDPYAAFNFVIEIENMPAAVAGFSEVTGANNENDAIEYRDGTDPPTVRKQAGLKKFGDITLKRGFTADRHLWDWRKSVLDGRTDRRDGSIVLRNEAGQDALRWHFRNAWPKKYSTPTFNAKTNEAAIEELVLAVEFLELENPT